LFFFFSSRRRHTRWPRDWSSDVCSSDLVEAAPKRADHVGVRAAVAVKGPLVVVGSADRLELLGDAEARGRKGDLGQRDGALGLRSEERRVGKEGRCRGGGSGGSKQAGER